MSINKKGKPFNNLLKNKDHENIPIEIENSFEVDISDDNI